MLSEQTALRLAAAMERLADIMEGQGCTGAAQPIHEDSAVASFIVGGPAALVAHNKRNPVSRKRSTSKQGEKR